MCEADTDLGETLPQVAFFGRPGFPTGLKHLMSGEVPPTFHQTPGQDQRLRRRQWLLGDRLDANTAIGQWSPKRITGPSLARTP